MRGGGGIYNFSLDCWLALGGASKVQAICGNFLHPCASHVPLSLTGANCSKLQEAAASCVDCQATFLLAPKKLFSPLPLPTDTPPWRLLSRPATPPPRITPPPFLYIFGPSGTSSNTSSLTLAPEQKKRNETSTKFCFNVGISLVGHPKKYLEIPVARPLVRQAIFLVRLKVLGWGAFFPSSKFWGFCGAKRVTTLDAQCSLLASLPARPPACLPVCLSVCLRLSVLPSCSVSPLPSTPTLSLSLSLSLSLPLSFSLSLSLSVSVSVSVSLALSLFLFLFVSQSGRLSCWMSLLSPSGLRQHVNESTKGGIAL